MPPSATPLPSERPLLKDALWYAAAASAAVGMTATDASAQIVYGDIEPDLTVQDTFVGGGTVAGETVDLDGDGDAEILFGEQIAGNYTIAGISVTDDGPDTVTAIVGNLFLYGGNNYAYWLPLSEGASIGPADATITGYGLATFNFGASDPNSWIGTGEHFIGFQFQLDGATTHYAWMRVEIPDGGTIVVKDFAFEATPDTPITAGATGVAIEPGPDGLPGTHALTDLAPNPFTGRAAFAVEVAETQAVRVEVYNALGQRVASLHDGALAAGAVHRFTLDGGDLASGVYVVRVIGERFTDTRTVTLAR